MNTLQIPRHDLDLEEALLAALILDSTTLEEVQDILRPEHFYRVENQIICRAIFDLAEMGQPIDSHMVATRLKDVRRFEQVGGVPALGRMLDQTPALANVRSYAEKVVALGTQRAVVKILQAAAAQGYDHIGDVQSFADGVMQQLIDATQSTKKATFRPVRDVLRATIEQIEAASRDPRGLSGYATGFDLLDQMLTGLHGGEFIVVAGRPGMGKSAFVGDLCLGVTADTTSEEQIACALFSLEMPLEQFGLRLLASEGNTNLKALRQGRVEEGAWDGLITATQVIGQLPLFMDDNCNGVVDIRSKIRRLQREVDGSLSLEPTPRRRKLGVVAVDYLQIVPAEGDEEDRKQEVSRITRRLKRMAKELNLVVIALAQLNRGPETRKDHRPIPADLRESGDIEQEADVILFLYRDEVYDPESRDAGTCEVIVAKQRNGETGRILLGFDKTRTRFYNLGATS